MHDKNVNSDPFYFDEVTEGIEHSYRITGNDGRYIAEKDGVFIAKLARYEVWEQEDGEPLSQQIFEMLVHRIDDHLLKVSDLTQPDRNT